MTKVCGKCKLKKSIENFNSRSEPNKKHILKSRCKQCETICSYKWATKNNVRIYDYRRARKDNLKKWFKNTFKNNPCVDCKQKFPSCCMDFDHKDGTIKINTLATLVGHGYSKESILEEVNKCDLICANCHRIRTEARGWNQWEKCRRKKSK